MIRSSIPELDARTGRVRTDISLGLYIVTERDLMHVNLLWKAAEYAQ